MTKQPTQKQLDYLKYLCNELGYDFDDYDGKSRKEIAEVIDDMKQELEGSVNE